MGKFVFTECLTILLVCSVTSTAASWISTGKQVDLGPYDSLVTWDKTTFVVSGHPCTTGKTASLSIIRIHDKPLFIHYDFIKKGLKEIKIDDTLAVSFEFKSKDHVNKNHFSLQMKKILVNATSGNKTYLPGFIMDLNWNMDQTKCLKHIGILTDPDKIGFRPQHQACTHSLRHGDFSTLCYQSDKALYMTVMNICDVPYSVNIVSMRSDSEISVHMFTKDKDKGLPMQILHEAGRHGECGLMVIFHGHVRNHEKQHVQLNYICTNKTLGQNATLIDDSYYTVYGMLCKLTECNRTIAEAHTCKQSMYNGKGKRVNSVFNLSLEVCDKDGITGDLEMTVEGFPKTFKANFSAMIGMLDNSKRKMFDLGTDPKDRKLNLHIGYEQLDGGEISLYVTENKLTNIFHVMLLRHFPYEEDRYPLMHDDFTIDKSKTCTKEVGRLTKRRKTGMQPWLIIVIVACCVLFVIVVVLLVRWWRSRTPYSAELGLPYHIDLDDDEFTIEKFEN